jgi:hypothetical protein
MEQAFISIKMAMFMWANGQTICSMDKAVTFSILQRDIRDSCRRAKRRDMAFMCI